MKRQFSDLKALPDELCMSGEELYSAEEKGQVNVTNALIAADLTLIHGNDAFGQTAFHFAALSAYAFSNNIIKYSK